MTDSAHRGDPAQTDDVIRRCWAAGDSIIATIKAVRNECGIGLGDAKVAVSTHPLWREFADAHNDVHRELIEAIKAEAADPSSGISYQERVTGDERGTVEFEISIQLPKRNRQS